MQPLAHREYFSLVFPTYNKEVGYMLRYVALLWSIPTSQMYSNIGLAQESSHLVRNHKSCLSLFQATNQSPNTQVRGRESGEICSLQVITLPCHPPNSINNET